MQPSLDERLEQEQAALQARSQRCIEEWEWRTYAKHFIEMGRDLGTFSKRAMVSAAATTEVDGFERASLTARDWVVLVAALTEVGILETRPGRGGGTKETVPWMSFRRLWQDNVPFPDGSPPVARPLWYDNAEPNEPNEPIKPIKP